MGGGSIAYTGPQIVIIGYGQSNWLKHMTDPSSPDAAVSGTSYFDGSSWTTVPAANGVRKMLNSIATTTGKTVGIISGGQTAVTIEALMPGGAGYFEALETKIIAAATAGAEAVYIVWHQGEGNANVASPNATTHRTALDTMHGHLVTALGRTKATVPFILSSLATVTDVSYTFPDTSWATIQTALATAHDTYPYIHYSHSNMDADLGGSPNVHWTPASYGRSGERYARKILALRGDIAAAPAWYIASMAIVDATHTDFTITHSGGTDFTPTSAITGFEISDNNGASYVVPSACVRQSATVIRATHSSLSTTADRTGRYQYGKTPVVTAPVVDNSSIASPLNHSMHQALTAAGSGALPVPTYRTAASRSEGNPATTSTYSALNLGASSTTEELMVICAVHFAGGLLPSVTAWTLTPSGGSAVAATSVLTSADTNPAHRFVTFIIPAGSNLSSASMVITHGSTFNNGRAVFATVPTGDLSSTTPVYADTAFVASGTVATIEATTSADGFYIALGGDTSFSGTATWTGDEAIAERHDAIGVGDIVTLADASGTAASTLANTVTVTFTASGALRLSVVSWR